MPCTCLKNSRKSKALYFCLFVIVCIVNLSYKEKHSPDDGQSLTSVTKTIHYRYHIRNNANTPVFESRFTTHAPLQKTGSQNCTRIETSHPYTLEANPDGNRRLQFSFESLSPYASKIISIRATLTLTSTPIPLPEPKPAQQTAWTTNTGPVSSDLRILALGLKSDSSLHTAENIHRWIVDHLTYSGYSAAAKGADHAFFTKEGDCTEFADLFVALARAAGLPARRVSGFLAPSSGKATPSNLHDWAEFFDNGVWRIADPQQKNFDQKYTAYIAMRIEEHANPQGRDRPFSLVSKKGKETMTVKMES